MHHYSPSFSFKDKPLIVLPTDDRLSQFEVDTIDTICQALEEVFAKTNAEICSDCPREKEEMERLQLPRHHKGCCWECAAYRGYFWDGSRDFRQSKKRRSDRQQQRKVLQKEFGYTQEHGFFIPNQGCGLPRARRSYTCLIYTCVYTREAGVSNTIVRGLVEGLTSIRERHNLIA